MRHLNVSVALALTLACSSLAAPASAQQNWYQCRAWGVKGTHEKVYVTPFINTNAAASTISEAFSKYAIATYPDLQLSGWSAGCFSSSASKAQQDYSLGSQEKQWATLKWEVVHIDWTDTPAQGAATTAADQSVATTAGVQQAAPNQNYVVCVSDREGPVVYVSDVFPAVMPPAPGAGRGNGGAQRAQMAAFQTPFLAFLAKKYGFKSGSSYPATCTVGFAPTAAGLQAALHVKQLAEDQARQNKKEVVETGWTNQ
ncbi:MAG TPA: hypothetical protein VJO52_08970 [Gemmatimonadaceae bacterium]|nr:hypothetical protein [Gemmatimonadaceae bacterium]